MVNVIVRDLDPRYTYCLSFLRQFVEEQYHATPPDAQNKALQFFRAMDTDGNGTVDYQEFRSFFRSEGFQDQLTSIDLFTLLDRNGDRSLDFWQVMTLYYILKTGIRCNNICNNCDACRQQRQQSNPMQGHHQQMSTAMIMNPSGGYPSQPSTSNNQIVPRNNQIVPRRYNETVRLTLRTLELALTVAGLAQYCSIM